MLLASGAVGVLGLWQLLAGTSRSAELAARGQAGMGEAAGRSIIRALDVALPAHAERAAARRLAGRAPGVKLTPVELIGLLGRVLAAQLGRAEPAARAAWSAFVVAIGGTILIARALIERRRSQRSEAFIEQLPEIARMLANGAAAGLSIPQALGLASRELADPPATELRRVVDELRVGQSVEDALANLRARLPSREVAVLMTTIAIQQRAGGDTVRALSELAATLEARKDLRREVTTLLSGVVFTSYVVAGIGGGTILLLNVMSPGVTKRDDELVHRAARDRDRRRSLWTIAFVLIRKTTKVDV